MYSDDTEMAEKLLAAKSKLQKTSQPSPEPVADKEKAMRMDHVNTRLSSGRYYIMQQSGQHIAFQVVCKHPEKRSYVQRVCFLGTDVAHLCLCLIVSVLFGIFL